MAIGTRMRNRVKIFKLSEKSSFDSLLPSFPPVSDAMSRSYKHVLLAKGFWIFAMKVFAVNASLSGFELFFNESSNEQGATK